MTPRAASVRAPTFTGAALDRAQVPRKDPAWVANRLASGLSLAVAASSEGILLDDSADRVARRRLEPAWREQPEPILLGIEGDAAVFAIDLDGLEHVDAQRLADGARVIGLREAGAELPLAEGGLAAYAVALLNWHRRHRFCANCGARTVVAEAGFSRRCERCGATHFPRTDPVVIMLVQDDERRLLLGHRAGWPEGRYSVLAGFVSPGESAEEAVAREVREESGIAVRDPRFVASQPWPFPSSLMLGFEATGEAGEPINHDGELDHVAWFTEAQVRPAASGRDGPLLLPPPVSIARFLIDGWLAG